MLAVGATAPKGRRSATITTTTTTTLTLPAEDEEPDFSESEAAGAASAEASWASSYQDWFDGLGGASAAEVRNEEARPRNHHAVLAAYERIVKNKLHFENLASFAGYVLNVVQSRRWYGQAAIGAIESTRRSYANRTAQTRWAGPGVSLHAGRLGQ